MNSIFMNALLIVQQDGLFLFSFQYCLALYMLRCIANLCELFFTLFYKVDGVKCCMIHVATYPTIFIFIRLRVHILLDATTWLPFPCSASNCEVHLNDLFDYSTSCL